MCILSQHHHRGNGLALSLQLIFSKNWPHFSKVDHITIHGGVQRGSVHLTASKVTALAKSWVYIAGSDEFS